MMQEVHCILTLMLGPPPKPEAQFSWEYYDANEKYHNVAKTPLGLAKELSTPSFTRSIGGANVNELFSLVNDPRNPYGQLLTVDRLGNVFGGRPVTYVNVDMDTMKKAAIAMLKAGLPAFFGCDVGKFSNSQSGIMDPVLYDYGLAFNITLNMSKSQRKSNHFSLELFMLPKNAPRRCRRWLHKGRNAKAPERRHELLGIALASTPKTTYLLLRSKNRSQGWRISRNTCHGAHRSSSRGRTECAMACSEFMGRICWRERVLCDG
jgi:hypothetical protein